MCSLQTLLYNKIWIFRYLVNEMDIIVRLHKQLSTYTNLGSGGYMFLKNQKKNNIRVHFMICFDNLYLFRNEDTLDVF